MVSRTPSASSTVCGRISASLEIAAESERDRPHARQPGVAVEDAGQGVLQRGAVVDARADHDLAVDLDAPVEQDLEPAQAGRPLRVAQHVGPEVGVGGVDGHEQRAEALGQDPLEVQLGEPGEGGEVAVEEGQPVVVVLQVEARRMPLGSW
jgi:hypothetical protein